MNQLFSTYKKWGVAGLKPGFVKYGKQENTEWIRKIELDEREIPYRDSGRGTGRCGGYAADRRRCAPDVGRHGAYVMESDKQFFEELRII